MVVYAPPINSFAHINSISPCQTSFKACLSAEELTGLLKGEESLYASEREKTEKVAAYG
jgi:hypothetical protein